MAVITGGTYVRSVAGDMDLNAIYTDEIRRTMDAQTLTSSRKQVWEDRFQWPLALALVCLFAELMLPVTRKTMVSILLVALLVIPSAPARANDTSQGIKAFEAGEYEKALKHFVDAQLEMPDKSESLYNVANAYYKTGNFDAAVEHYEKVLEADDQGLKQKALYNLGNAEFRRGNAKAAIDHYKTALSIDPNDRLTKDNMEFVQKVMEQQQQQQQSDKNQQDQKNDQGQDQEKQDKQDGQDQDSSEAEQEQQQGQDQKPSPDEQQAQQQPESGSEADQAQDQQSASSGKPGEEPQEDKQAAAASQPDDSKPQADDSAQTDRMLNRLQDQPGRALMPARGRQQVDKDW
jgi:Ca-activated chloride channel family protein